MTGHIPGTTVLRVPTRYATQNGLGSNQSGLRAANERLILSLIRTHGQLSKAQIAELSGLAMQTSSVISRSLVDAGLLAVGEIVRGKVGQPFMPLKLNPDGAMFLGVHLGGTEVHVALVDFVGGIISEEMVQMPNADLGRLTQFVLDTASRVRAGLAPDRRSRFQGVGVSIDKGSLTANGGPIPWSDIDAAFVNLRNVLDVSVHVASDAFALCSAEVIYGIGSGLPEFLYVFLDHSVSGGMVQDGRIGFSSDELGPNLGKIRVPDGKCGMVPLNSLALDQVQDSAGMQALRQLAVGIADATISVASIMRCQTVVIDGLIAPELLRQVVVDLRAALARLDAPEASEIAVREGSSRRKSLALGAACLPLADRFYPSDPT